MKNKTGTGQLRHIPLRTCIACRKTTAKRELVRLVCLPDGSVEVDSTGKKSGRGAYLCPDRSCWETALKSGKLEYALKTRLNSENREKLLIYGQEFANQKNLSV